tara:strand:- start:1152 stop:1364 length:213 start_codon:yes stop_codon:yes gene_type:complete
LIYSVWHATPSISFVRGKFVIYQEKMSKFRQKWPDFGRFPERPEGRGLMDNPSEALNIIGYGGGEKTPCS